MLDNIPSSSSSDVDDHATDIDGFVKVMKHSKYSSTLNRKTHAQLSHEKKLSIASTGETEYDVKVPNTRKSNKLPNSRTTFDATKIVCSPNKFSEISSRFENRYPTHRPQGMLERQRTNWCGSEEQERGVGGSETLTMSINCDKGTSGNVPLEQKELVPFSSEDEFVDILNDTTQLLMRPGSKNSADSPCQFRGDGVDSQLVHSKMISEPNDDSPIQQDTY